MPRSKALAGAGNAQAMTPARQTVEALRRFLRTGQNNAAQDLPELLVRAQGIISADSTPGDDAATAGECVFLLAACLRTQRDPLMAYRLFLTLAVAGKLGRAYAALHIQSRAWPLPQCSALLQTLPGHDFLALLNDLLLDCPAEDKQLALWLRTLLPAPGRLDGREALLFLKTMAPTAMGDGAPLARPLRDALLAAGLSESMPAAFVGMPGAATAEALLLAAETLAVPAMQAEALAYALRSAGAEGPSRLQPLLAAPPDLEPRDVALATEMRRLALSPDAPERLLSAAQTEPEMLGLVLADLMTGDGPFSAAAQRLLPLLPRLGVDSALAALPQEAHGIVYARLLSALAQLEPDFLRRAAKTLGLQSGLDAAAGQALADLLRARPGLDAQTLFSSAAWTAQATPTGPASPLPRSAQSRRSTLADVLKNVMLPLKDLEFSHSTLADQVLEGVTISGSNLSHCRFSGVTFRRMRLSAVQLHHCEFINCLFQSCVFYGADLSGSRFQTCRWGGVSFESSDLSRVRLEGCSVGSGAFAESCLAGASLVKTRLESVSFRTCALAGLRILECALARLTFTRTDISGALWEKSVCRDLDFTSSSLAAARILGSECLNLRLLRTVSPSLTVLGGHTDSPRLLQAEAATRARCLDSVCQDLPELAAPLRSGAGAKFVRACVDKFLRVDEARRTLAAMRGQDQRRRELALDRLTEPQGQLLGLLPVLLTTSVFEQAQDLQGVPACAISGHARLNLPTREDRAVLERLFPGQELPRSAKELPEPVLILEAVYAIGSLGSVAQKPSSDVDCWVCVSPAPGCRDFPAARTGLVKKLHGLEIWAWEQFSLELHFFPMAMDEVRLNNFGMSDKESSGSAQAALLKEEFYRTALKLAGRDLLWWAAPPLASQAEAQELLADLSRLAPRTASELVDLGQPQAIPPQEYFGACLWQIVKALHSPYKSVMKLGLLEKYAGQGQDMRLLCDRIKEAVLRGRRLAEDVDPYLSLFTSIRKHYRQLGDPGSLGLIGECLRLKADVAPEDLPAEFDAPGLALSPSAAQGGDAGAFGSALRLGGMVNQFMISAYRRIQGGLRAHQGGAQISPEDLTRLGRRIAANFAQHPHKVVLVPFLSDEVTFTELSFYAEKAPGKRTIWGVKGKDKSAGKVAVETLAPIRRDTDVVRLLAWLLFNGLYDPRQIVQAERSLAPIALLDLQAVLADLAAFFPRRATLEPDLDEYLQSERVARAYVITNLPVPTDKNKILTASVLYSTNWGEVFCQTFDNPPLTLQKAPLVFLSEALARPITRQMDLRFFAPKKSAAPKLKLE
ncbi:MAG: class I adenylate cyclase [Humidesulfovibrio sp.]|uniref:class I adenylate cyclase n=1 Tax=Humidesulfovibrio sp. TaxID=2910988 RepID=UPI0027366DA9|nr:class I adenylate cyclase [Humidesulfovibrio sp.]MDP2846624.1 class I adenylate cyclase [Humidesulfovibrio sp.]